MNTTLPFFAGATAVTLSASEALALGQARGAQGLEDNRAECTDEANCKGLIGPSKRVERQAFMQTYVDGSN